MSFEHSRLQLKLAYFILYCCYISRGGLSDILRLVVGSVSHEAMHCTSHNATNDRCGCVWLWIQMLNAFKSQSQNRFCWFLSRSTIKCFLWFLAKLSALTFGPAEWPFLLFLRFWAMQTVLFLFCQLFSGKNATREMIARCGWTMSPVHSTGHNTWG